MHLLTLFYCHYCNSAYRASVGESSADHTSGNGHVGVPRKGRMSMSSDDEELQLAMALSRQLSLEEERRRRLEQEEEDELQRALRLSLEDQ